MMAARKQFLLRMDPVLHAELEAWAAAELRSVNAQIEYLLRQAVKRRKGSGSPDVPPDRPGAGRQGGPDGSGSSA